MDDNKSKHEAAAFEEFWLWKDDQGIGADEKDWRPWWECFWAGYKSAIKCSGQAGQETLNRLWHCAECGTGYFKEADAIDCCRGI